MTPRPGGLARAVRRAALLALLAGCGEAAEEDTGAARSRGDAPMAHDVRVLTGREGVGFEPPEVRVRPGDTVRFLLHGPGPAAIAFDTAATAPGAVEFVRSLDLERGPLLTSTGQSYVVPFAGAPPGRYPFRALTGPHARGAVVVEPPR